MTISKSHFNHALSISIIALTAYSCGGESSPGTGPAPDELRIDSPGTPVIHRLLGAGDFDGDGSEDWAAGDPYVDDECRSGEVQVWYGQFNESHPDQRWRQPERACDVNFGAAVAVGDFDGDGYDDIAIGAPGDVISGQANAGSVQVLYGTRFGLSADGAQLFSQDTPGVDNAAQENDAFGTAVASGDFDCDGYADLAIGVPGESMAGSKNAGAVHIIFGGARGLSSARSRFIQPTEFVGNLSDEDNYFGSFISAGNIDGGAVEGNSCDDLAIGIPGASPPDSNSVRRSAAGAVAVLYSNGSVLDTSNIELWHQGLRGVPGEIQDSNEFGRGVWIMDEDGDGYGDLFAYSAGDETLSLPRGSVEGLTSSGADATKGIGRRICYFLCEVAWAILPPGPVCDCSVCEMRRVATPKPCPNCV